MAKTRVVHRCGACGATTARWAGRCPTCDEWNSLVEEIEQPAPTGAASTRAAAAPVRLAAVDVAAHAPIPTGSSELDRVLGGGLVPGSVTLVGGEPGVGKSTLLLHVLAAVAARGDRALLVSAEESSAQVRVRAERIGTVADGLWILPETTLPSVLAAAREIEPAVVVVDSIQTLVDPDVGSSAGSVTQVRDCAAALVEFAKSSGTAVVLVGHVTKDGNLAGPRVLEHVVDTVLSFEGDRHHALRLLRAVKHRFGPVGELGVFEMTDAGLVAVPDAGGLFLGDRRTGVAGSVVAAATEGRRTLLVEIQALVSETHAVMPRRSAHGLDGGRLNQLLAVLEKHCKVPFGKDEVYASAVGGIRVVEPAADLPLALAIVSTKRNRALPGNVVAFGEVGLSGDIRQVSHAPRRLIEAARLGFTRAIVPYGTPGGPASLRMVRVSTINEAIAEAMHGDDANGQDGREQPARLRAVGGPRHD